MSNTYTKIFSLVFVIWLTPVFSMLIEKELVKQKNGYSFLEKLFNKYHDDIENIIVRETMRYRYEKEKFIPQSPSVLLQKLNIDKKVNKILSSMGYEFELEFMYFLRKYKNVRGAWNLFIGNILAMEDLYE